MSTLLLSESMRNGPPSKAGVWSKPSSIEGGPPHAAERPRVGNFDKQNWGISVSAVIDTDQLRVMASKTVQVADDFGDTEVSCPTSLGHAGMTEAVSFFSEKWGVGLKTRVDELGEFAEKLETTARIFDEGHDAGKRELDSLIWDS
ncbi:MAG: hypothetical protein QM630_00835 [Microbacterium sp.]